MSELFSNDAGKQLMFSLRQVFQEKRIYHRKGRFMHLLRVDFQDFFPSLRAKDVTSVLESNQKFLADGTSDADIAFITLIVCRNDALSIGAPTSPHLSNAIMFRFDELWSQRATSLDTGYTRYADDLYFSTNHPNVLEKLLPDIREYLASTNSPRLRINNKKTAFSSRKRRRLAAGLVLTSDRKISLGRSRKRVLKALMWKLKRRELQPGEIASLRGWVAYLRSVEPTFVQALERKYNLDLASDGIWQA